jgi:hypothetical protein
MTAEITSLYAKARKAGYPAAQALRAAKIVNDWQSLESDGKVRMEINPEEDSYFDVYGEPDAYEGENGKRVSAEQAKVELVDLLDRWGCYYVVTEYLDANGEWQHADFIGMCVYLDPADWRENWYIPDLMAEAIRLYTESRQGDERSF